MSNNRSAELEKLFDEWRNVTYPKITATTKYQRIKYQRITLSPTE